MRIGPLHLDSPPSSGGWIGLSPVLLTAGIAMGILHGSYWPMAAGWTLILIITAVALLGELLRNGASATTAGPAALWLAGWLGWSALGAGLMTTQPSVAWNSWAMDALGCTALLAGMEFARSAAAQRWRIPVLSAAVMVLAIAAASFGNGDLALRGVSVWGGINIGTVTNLMVPLLLTPFLVPAMRPTYARWEFVLVTCALFAGVAISLLTGRRLALAGLLLTVGMAGVTWSRNRVLRFALGAGMASLLLVITAFAFGLLPGFQTGDALRPLIYGAAWGEFLLHPLTGIGPAGGYTMQEGASEAARILTASGGFVVHAHSSLLEILVSGGAIGGALLATGLWKMAKNSREDERAIGLVICAGLLPTILFDAAPGDIFGHLWLPFLFGCAFTPAVPATTSRPGSAYPYRLMHIIGLACGCWLLFEALLITRIKPQPALETQLTALAHLGYPDLANQIVNQVNREHPGLTEEANRAALDLAIRQCGWCARWPEQRWLQRQDPPTAEDLGALAAIIRRSPFQDAPYLILERIDPTQLTPELSARKKLLATLTPDSPGLDGALVVWRQTIATALRAPLSSEQQAAYGNLLQRYAEIPGVAAVGCWLHAREQLDGTILVPLASRLQFAINSDGSLLLGMLRTLTPIQLARLHELEQRSGLYLPQAPRP